MPLRGADRVHLAGLAGLRWGQGPVSLVFLHANGFCASTYAGLLAPLVQAGAGSILALDLRGHGRSTLPADPLLMDSWNVHAADVAAALDAAPEGVRPGGAVLAGHSMGGQSAHLLAAARPDLAARCVLLDPVWLPGSFYLLARLPGAFRRLRERSPMSRAALRRRAVFASREEAARSWQGRGAFRTWTGSFLADFCVDGLSDLPGGTVTLSCAPAFEAACYAGHRHDPYGAHRHVRAPLLVVRAAKGSTCPEGTARWLARRGADVRTPDGSSHFLPMESPDLCRDLLARALAQTAG